MGENRVPLSDLAETQVGRFSGIPAAVNEALIIATCPDLTEKQQAEVGELLWASPYN